MNILAVGVAFKHHGRDQNQVAGEEVIARAEIVDDDRWPALIAFTFDEALIAFTFDEAESARPGCSAAWDAQGGPAWLDGRDGMTIVITKSGVAIGCGVLPPFGWALWDEAHETWIFL